MKSLYRAAGLAGVMLTGAWAATSTPAQDEPQADRPEYVEPRVYSALEAVRGVNEEGGSIILPGQFAFVVKGGGRDADRVFLNSESNYRDAETLTVVLSGAAVAALTTELGGPPESRLIGRTIVVNGVARRVRVDLLSDGRPTGQSYLQTHIDARQVHQVHVVPGQALPITVIR